MKCIKIIILLIILFNIFTLSVNANTSNDVVYNLIEEYFKNYQLEETPDDLKLDSYEIKNVKISSETPEEILASFSAIIFPHSNNYTWATTDIHYNLRIEKNNNSWEITKMATGPIEPKNYTATNTDVTTRQIVYNLVGEYLESCKMEDVSNNLKIKFYEIESISIISETEEEITSSVTFNIIPYDQDILISNLEKNTYTFVIRKINNEWEIYNSTEIHYENKNLENNNHLYSNNKLLNNTLISQNTILIICSLIFIIIFILIVKKRNIK